MSRSSRTPTDDPFPGGSDRAFIGHPERRGRTRRRLLVPLIVMALAVGAVATANATVVPKFLGPSNCRAATISSMVPKDGTLLGVNLDWASESLAQHRKKLGHAPAATVQFLDVPYDDATWSKATNAVTQLKQNGGILLLTLEPHAGLDAVSDEVIAGLATDLAAINAQGVPVLLRFAHEMNGSWYAWGQQPRHYIQVFRKVAQAVHTTAPGTAMMWAPNYGGGYPFAGGKFAARPGTRAFRDLDTNGNGALTMADDTYSPYYPGDDAVDWVGISLYHWGNRRPWGNNEIPEPGKFLNMLTGNYSGTAGNDAAIPDFYHVYGVRHAKPVAIPETAAIYTPSRHGASELAIKQAWWRQVFSDEVHQQFPDLKMINWFEWNKFEIEIKDDVDWRSAGSPAVRAAFDRDLPTWLRYADDVKTCD